MQLDLSDPALDEVDALNFDSFLAMHRQASPAKPMVDSSLFESMEAAAQRIERRKQERKTQELEALRTAALRRTTVRPPIAPPVTPAPPPPPSVDISDNTFNAAAALVALNLPVPLHPPPEAEQPAAVEEQSIQPPLEPEAPPRPPSPPIHPSISDTASPYLIAFQRGWRTRRVLLSRPAIDLSNQLKDVRVMLDELLLRSSGGGGYEASMIGGLRSQIRKQVNDLVSLCSKPLSFAAAASKKPAKPKPREQVVVVGLRGRGGTRAAIRRRRRTRRRARRGAHERPQCRRCRRGEGRGSRQGDEGGGDIQEEERDDCYARASSCGGRSGGAEGEELHLLREVGGDAAAGGEARGRGKGAQ